MPQKNVTLSLDGEIYNSYRKFCERNAIALSKSVENFMREKMQNQKKGK